ncbi:DegT/DnrJ/EryC1/StrS family aminotransferase [Nodosilinea sp. PGN35]|uniref:DegT/DnrJ/EryC1/StrS family aminotransferase n=1 Tax=Nodosilinea sp. PGN35 TaxID=3020489 RepID=UPI0023B336E7|nr:DegT/DnrJ/EryC1/StrS family aminotransferase [Nodosilinea sp. TSF1-S3]MDF0364657.1 DegT/DnrJ/EryC1/StrS family aminotransferase [Nodosilinea sp. TSF1-S3]
MDQLNRRNIAISLPSTGEEEWQAVREPIMTGWLTQGPKVAAFEQRFATRHQVKHAIATTSCTTALHLILIALGVGPGDEVIVPAFTWVSTANVVMYCGATPIFVDVDRTTFNLDVHQVKAKISDRTKAIIPVHLFGLCADIDALAAVAPNIPLIEDAACAVGSTYQGRSAGSLGLAGAFSFHPRKSITTGEGGMITTNDDRLAETMRQLRNHGASISEEQRHLGPKPYLLPDFNLLGFNYRMTDLQGAVGLVQLSKLDGFLAERRQWAEFYHQSLGAIEWLRTPAAPADYGPGWQAYVCYVDESKSPMPRNTMMEALQEKGISTRPGTHAVHLLGAYKDRFGLRADDFPAARDCDRYSLAIPLHNQMTAADYDYVVKNIVSLA